MLPTASACVAVNECAALVNDDVVKLQAPPALTVAVPIELAPSKIVSVAPGSPLPLRICVKEYVVIGLMVGVFGVMVSTSRPTLVESALVFPAISVADAFNE